MRDIIHTIKHIGLLIFVFIPCLLLISHLLSLVSYAQVPPQWNPIQQPMAVTAIVPPGVPDFQFALKYNGDSLVHQDQTLHYEITYGASSSAGLSTTNTIVMHYSQDKAPDQSYLVDYIFNSATKGYGNLAPVVDTRNRTITWTIPSLPEGTMDKKLYFQLRANGHTHDLKRMMFWNRASMSNEYVSMPLQQVHQDYLFDPALVTPGPTATPPPQSAPTPTAAPKQFVFNDISIESISPASATIAVLTNTPTRAYIRYGTSPTALTQQTSAAGFGKSHQITITELTQSTRYYYQVIATDGAGKRSASDIFTFETAQSPATIMKDNDAYIFSSGDTVLLSRVLKQGYDDNGFFLLPTNIDYKLIYTFAQPPDVSHLEAIVHNENDILQKVQMTQISPTTWVAQLRTISQGTYNIDVIQSDSKGNIMSRKISLLKITTPITVLESNGFSPLVDARILLSQWNTSTNKYETTNKNNPRFTDKHGQLTLLLPQGKYRIEVSALGHAGKTVDFSIGPETGSGYPTVTLEQDLLNIGSLFTFIKNQLFDSFMSLLVWIKELSNSIRAYTMAAAIAITVSVYVCFLLFRIRTDIRWDDIIPFFTFHMAVLHRKHHEAYILGAVLDTDNKPVSSARIELVHVKTAVVMAHALTNKAGIFRIPNTFKEPYLKLVASKDGLAEVAMIVSTQSNKALTVRLQGKRQAPFAAITAGVDHVTSGFFEVILLLNLCMELLFLDAFGVAKTLPFIVLTFFNLALWIFYQKEHNQTRI